MPSSNPKHIYRSELIERFEQGLNSRLIVVSAPAGSGKSTFVSEAIRKYENDCCWVSLDEPDSDPKLFLKLLLTSLQEKRPEFGVNTVEILQSSSAISTDQIITSFVNELAEIDRKTFLVLDDFHSLDSTEIDEVISFFIEHKPATLVLILVTREDPSIPLARLRASGQLVEFRAADLRFTEQDVTALFLEKLQLGLSETQIHSITQRTEGWIAGIQLAALSIQGSDDVDNFIDQFSGNHRFILDYLIEEVIQQLDSKTKTFIFTTAKLPRFSAELCDDLLQTSDSKEIIQNLNRQNLFIIPLDDQGRWYRFHHLFSEALNNHSSLDRHKYSEISVIASKWFFNHGFFVESITLALDAKANTEAIFYLEKIWTDFRTHSNDAQLIKWLKDIPEIDIQKSPLISTFYAVALLSCDFEKANIWLLHSEKAIAEHPSNNLSENYTLKGYIEIGKAYKSISEGQIEKVFEHTQKALQFLEKDDHVMRSAAEILRGLMYWHAGELDAADISISNGYKQLKLTHDFSATISTAYLLANIRIVQGHREDAMTICQKNIKVAERLEYTPQGYADIYVTLAWLEIGKNNFDIAKSYLAAAYHLGESAKLLESAHTWYVISAFIAVEERDFMQAEELLEEARAIKVPSPAPDFAPIDLWETRFEIQQGQLEKAQSWADKVQIDHEKIVNSSFLILTLVRLRLEQYKTKQLDSDLDEMIALLELLKQQLISKNQAGIIIEVELFLSRLYLTKQHFEKAAKKLLSALNQREPQNQLYLFIGVFNDQQEWLQRTTRSFPEAKWLMHALETLQNNTKPSALANDKQNNHEIDRENSLIEPLSGREIEVLQALKSELSGPEIADSLFVSLNTLRTHTKNIYSKLDVNNRRAAIRKAVELNI